MAKYKTHRFGKARVRQHRLDLAEPHAFDPKKTVDVKALPQLRLDGPEERGDVRVESLLRGRQSAAVERELQKRRKIEKDLVARAGAGKTRTLVTRALFLLKHCGVSASEVLM